MIIMHLNLRLSLEKNKKSKTEKLITKNEKQKKTQ